MISLSITEDFCLDVKALKVFLCKNCEVSFTGEFKNGSDKYLSGAMLA